MTRPIEEILESMEWEAEHSGGWVLPNGANALISVPGGHLSVVHTASIREWAAALRAEIEGRDAVPVRSEEEP